MIEHTLMSTVLTIFGFSITYADVVFFIVMIFVILYSLLISYMINMFKTMWRTIINHREVYIAVSSYNTIVNLEKKTLWHYERCTNLLIISIFVVIITILGWILANATMFTSYMAFILACGYATLITPIFTFDAKWINQYLQITSRVYVKIVTKILTSVENDIIDNVCNREKHDDNM